MTKFNISKLPGLGNAAEVRFAPEVISFAFYGRKPKIAGAVAKLRIVAASNPGVEAEPAQPVAQPIADHTKQYLANESLRQAAAGMLEEFQDEGQRNQDYIDFLTEQARIAASDNGAGSHEYELPA